MVIQNQQGVKRKRYEAPEEEISVKIGGKLHHVLREVRKASKKAKTFETQKIVKKLKDLRKKESDAQTIADSEAQLTALKDISHDEIGNTALKTRLLKDRILAIREDVQEAISTEISSNIVVLGAAGTPLAKVQSRLLSSKLVAAEVSTAIKSLQNLLLPRSKDGGDVEKVPEDVEVQLAPLPKKAKVNIKNSGDVAENKSSLNPETTEHDDDLHETEKMGGSVSGDEDEEVGVEDDGWESGSIDGDQFGSVNLNNGSDSEDTDDNDEDNESPPPPSRPKIKPAAQPKSKAAPSSTSQSTFLPSLAVGFTRGSDDSDWSDTEGNAADVDIKKNRRGQRARRAIWEKKYGRNANHKKKEAVDQNTTQANGPQRGHSKYPTSTAPSKGGASGHQTGDMNFDKAKGAKITQDRQLPDSGWASRGSSFVARPQRKEDKPLHPSWEAKKKLKERESAGILPSQGKKIIFS